MSRTVRLYKLRHHFNKMGSDEGRVKLYLVYRDEVEGGRASEQEAPGRDGRSKGGRRRPPSYPFPLMRDESEACRSLFLEQRDRCLP